FFGLNAALAMILVLVLRRHEQFRLAVSACPNGCVRPQVADLGLVATRSVAVDATACVGCNVCAETCPTQPS
ncbi:4Fe-4S binding protein, partial [Desulfovibrio sp. DV]|uniref:4Fe-4S binding protein n=1 Tax=Desulfovibrio sp. DV TaxID=1844708 RepID=UPI00158816DD